MTKHDDCCLALVSVQVVPVNLPTWHVTVQVPMKVPASPHFQQAASVLRIMGGICSTDAVKISTWGDLEMDKDHEMGCFVILVHLAVALLDEAVGYTVSRLPISKAAHSPKRCMYTSSPAVKVAVLLVNLRHQRLLSSINVGTRTGDETHGLPVDKNVSHAADGKTVGCS